MTTSPKTLFSSLVAGDLLMVPIRPPLVPTETTFFAAVLRVDDKGRLYLSRFSEHHPVSLPNVSCNPFRWSDDKGALVDCDGEVPRWYTVDISVERRGAEKAAAEYDRVPRFEHLRHQFTKADLEGFMKDPRFALISGIGTNGEAGNPAHQMSLVLDVMGVHCTKEQLVGIAWHLFRTQVKSDTQIALISLGADNDADPAESNLPNQ